MDKKRGFLAFLFLCLLSTLPFISASTPVFAASAENTWQTAEPLPEAVVGGRAGVVDGKIYVMDGYLNYQYDPASDTWTAKKPMPTPRILFGMAVWQDKIYVIGGGKGVDESNQRWSILSDAVEVYDPSTDTWQTKQPMPTARAYLEASVVNGQIYLVGGMNNKDKYVNLNEVYTVANDSWAMVEPIPYSVYSYASAVCGDKIYIIGGQSLQAPITNVNYVQIYDCSNNSWSFGTPMPTFVWLTAAGATTGEAAIRRIYVMGGVTSDDDVLGDVQVYDPQIDAWTLGASIPSVRNLHAVAVVDDRIYVIGGDPYCAPGANYDPIGNLVWYTHNEVYTPFGYGSPDPAYVLEHYPPGISVVSPLNQTYNETAVSLLFNVDKTVDWMGYSLDGQDNVAISGNTTITDLANGLHNVTVYARDAFDNTGASETIIFNVEMPEPFPTTLVAAAYIASAGIIAVGLLVYFKKRKH